jgi:hypothetical protein
MNNELLSKEFGKKSLDDRMEELASLSSNDQFNNVELIVKTLDDFLSTKPSFQKIREILYCNPITGSNGLCISSVPVLLCIGSHGKNYFNQIDRTAAEEFMNQEEPVKKNKSCIEIFIENIQKSACVK